MTYPASGVGSQAPQTQSSAQAASLSPDLQNLNQTSGFVELYVLDLTALGGAVYHYTNNISAIGGSLSFNGVPYTAIPIKSEGWNFVSTGQAPKPTLTVGNVQKNLLALVVSLGDMVGAKVTRYRTYEKYLDNGATPDGSKFLGPEVFLIEQKIAHNKTFISWQLTSIIDRFGMKLPRRQVLKDKGFPGVARTRIR